jgi:hypothetical protein
MQLFRVVPNLLDARGFRDMMNANGTTRNNISLSLEQERQI